MRRKMVIAALAALPCHAVGKRTAEAARKAGFCPSAKAQAMPKPWRQSGGDCPGQDRLVYTLWPGAGFPAFEQRLEAAGVPVQAVETI